jgi:hypothetical protein
MLSELHRNKDIKIKGILDLKPFIESTENGTFLSVDNMKEASLNDLFIGKHDVLSLSLFGAIRVTSRIDYILKVGA